MADLHAQYDKELPINDTPPAVSLLTTKALTASHVVLIPAQPTELTTSAMQGLLILSEQIQGKEQRDRQ